MVRRTALRLVVLFTLCAWLARPQGRDFPLGPPITVAGAVKAPVTFQAGDGVTLFEAITRAGGLTAAAGSQILVRRARSEVVRVWVQALIDGTHEESNLRLFGGEEVRIPEAGRVFVVGNVRRPGAFPIDDGGQTSVLEVLARAQGLTPFWDKQAYIYRPRASGGKREMRIELSGIVERRVPDTHLLANDILYIPDSHHPRVGLVVLEKLLLFGGSM